MDSSASRITEPLTCVHNDDDNDDDDNDDDEGGATIAPHLQNLAHVAEWEQRADHAIGKVAGINVRSQAARVDKRHNGDVGVLIVKRSQLPERPNQ